MRVYVVLAVLFLLASCASSSEKTVELLDVDGNIIGTAMLSETETGVSVQLSVGGLSSGEHGFHIHEKGDCSASDFKSAGGHFNPLEEKHGAHAGDLTNIPVGDDGKAESTQFIEDLTLATGKLSILGRAFVIHAGADDYTSQPSGAAGARVACGVIS